uniref:WH2 domain-containing protein n=1 Tax=Ascaris lumbricoides TaxID=6252 RepID=A0A9J2Q6W9_ASCLU
MVTAVEHPPPSPAPVSKPSVAKNSALRPPSRLQPPSVKTSKYVICVLVHIISSVLINFWPLGLSMLLWPKHPPPSPAPVSKPSVAKNSALRPPSRLQPPSVKTSNLNNNIPSRCSSRSSSLASSGTYSSIPSLSSVPSSPGQSATTNIQNPPSVAGSKMLKIKLFGGGKEREKDRKSPSLGVADAKSSKSTNVVSKSSGLVKPKASGLKAPGKLMPPSHIVTKVSIVYIIGPLLWVIDSSWSNL